MLGAIVVGVDEPLPITTPPDEIEDAPVPPLATGNMSDT